MDGVVKSWIIGTITDDLAATISARDSTARDAWVAVESQFLNNRKTRALLLDTKFRNFAQGDLSIAEYSKEMKRMADMLADLGEVVSDRTLVLNVIRGLSERFKTVGMHLRHGCPFPTFADAQADLFLEQLTMEHQTSQAAALAASTTSTHAPTSQPPAGRAGSGGGSGAKGGATSGGASAPASKSRRSKRGGKSFGGQGTQAGQGAQAGDAQARTTSWPSYNPWTSTIQMWPGPRLALAPLPARPP
jgi:hypothetical protein